MTNEPSMETKIQRMLILAIKELGEIAECVVKNEHPSDRWKNELCDLCGLAIEPMRNLAEIDYDTACMYGHVREHAKMEERS